MDFSSLKRSSQSDFDALKAKVNETATGGGGGASGPFNGNDGDVNFQGQVIHGRQENKTTTNKISYWRMCNLALKMFLCYSLPALAFFYSSCFYWTSIIMK